MTVLRSGLSTPLVLGAIAFGCGPGTSAGPGRDGGDPARDAEVGPDAGSPDDAAMDGPDWDDGEPVSASAIIHARHRAIPGVMFGGWGPHLGHLLRRRLASGDDELWFVDDACAPASCSVDHDTTLAVLRFDGAAWTLVDELALPAGIQQNTASVL